MAHYALLDENNVVTQVIVGPDENLDGVDWEQNYANLYSQTCKRTSYNTVANTHSGDGTAFRGNYAGIGYTYDADNDVFKAPTPYASWVMNESIWTWEAPVDRPDLTEEEVAANSYYVWNEDTTSWDLITP